MPEASDRGDVTLLLRQASSGDKAAANELVEAIGRELHKIASIHMRRERVNHTLQPTAVMNEAVIRLLGKGGTEWQDRQHFLAVASRVMRRLLVDYARRPNAPAVSLDDVTPAVGPISPRVLDVHKALEEFHEIAPRQAQLVELRFFGGLTLEEAAQVLDISPRLADKDWALARAWLNRRLGGK